MSTDEGNQSINHLEEKNVIDEYKNRHIVVTGGMGGLGRAVVQAFLAKGAWCHVPHRSPAIRKNGPGQERLRLVPEIDLTNERAVMSFYASLPPLWASIHVAGGFGMWPVTDTQLSDFRAQLDVNITTCFLCCREAVRKMRARAAVEASSSGRIVNVAARPALVPTEGMLAYSVAKAAVVSLTQCLAAEVKGEKILVNAIAPSIIDTPDNRKAMPHANYALWPTPEEVAETILFLSSPSNCLTTGVVVPVYGIA